MKSKVVYIISNIDKALSFEWIATQLSSDNFELHFILLNPKANSNLELFLKENNVKVSFIKLSGKKSYPFVFAKLLFYLIKIQPQVVHTHLYDANLLGLTAAYFARIKKRIYTRHHSTLHHDFFPKGVKLDSLCNCMATHIVSISGSTYYVLTQLENVPTSKIISIPHGFKLSEFQSVSKEKVSALHLKYNIQRDKNYPVIGVIARYTHWKGHCYIIEAFKELLKSYPSALLLLANAQGDYATQVKEQLKDLPVQNYIEISFEQDLFALYKLFDVYVHVPINKDIEAFGQTYIEAMASGIPSIFTKSGIGNDVCQDSRNCIVVDYKNSEEIYSGLIKLTEDKSFYSTISINAPKSVINYDLQYFIKNLEDLYLKV
jgi:glycosyltransferase involved in cell wall biosynthesis